MRAAQLNISLLGVVVVAIGIPAAFHLQNGRSWTEPPEGLELEQILQISRGLAIMLLFLYLVYLVLCARVSWSSCVLLQSNCANPLFLPSALFSPKASCTRMPISTRR
jgi:Ca2+/H+ antiporter